MLVPPNTCVVRGPAEFIVVWVEGTSGPPVTVDGAPVSTGTQALGGTRYEVPVAAATLQVGSTEPGQRLLIRPWERSEAVTNAIAAWRAGRPDDAVAMLDDATLPAAHDAQDAAWVQAWITRPEGLTALAEGPEVPAYLATKAAVTLSNTDANVRREGPTAVSLAQRARQSAAQLGPWVPFELGWAIEQAEGFALQNAGDHRNAIARLEAGRRMAAEVGDAVREAEMVRLTAESERRAGRPDAARQTLRTTASSHPDACVRAATRIDLAWHLAQEAVDDRTELEALLQQSVADLRAGICPPTDRTRLLAHAFANLAVAVVRDGKAERASAHAAASRAAFPGIDEPMLQWVDARVLELTEDWAGALEAHRDLEVRAGEQLEMRWLAIQGQASALERTGRIDDAIAQYQRGQQVLFEQSLHVPVHRGRGRFLAEHAASTARLAQALVERGRPREAFDAHRMLRAQLLLGVHQLARRDQASTPVSPAWYEALAAFRDVDEQRRAAHDGSTDARLREQAMTHLDRGLAALGLDASGSRRRPAPGEALLGWFATPDGWAGFTELDDTVLHATLPAASDPPTPEALVAPFRRLLDEARIVTVLLDESARAVDVHVPLLRTGLVRYGLDLAARVTDPALPTGSLLAVGNPTRDLPLAAREVRSLEETGAQSGWTTTLLVESEATTATVTQGAPHTQVFHFSGHATASVGWGAQLHLADGVVGIGDILAWPTRPTVAVLNACDTAAAPGVGSVGLAQAFVAAGTQAAVASARPVRDSLAARFTEHFYGQMLAGERVSDAYRAAVLRLAEERSAEGWPTFRLIVP